MANRDVTAGRALRCLPGYLKRRRVNLQLKPPLSAKNLCGHRQSRLNESSAVLSFVFASPCAWMECKVCEQLKTKLYCQKCVKDGVRLQNHQLLAVARKKDEAFDKVKEFLNTDVSRRICQAHAERDEKKYVIKAARQEIERIQGVIRKGIKIFPPSLTGPWMADVVWGSRTPAAGEHQGGCRYEEE